MSTWGFLKAVRDCYALKTAVQQHATDLEWINRKWADEPMHDAIYLFGTMDQATLLTARDVAKVYSASPLYRIYIAGGMLADTTPHRFETRLDNILWCLTGDTFLSDVTMTFALHKVCLGIDSCFIMDLVRAARGSPRPTDLQLVTVALIIMPVNIGNLHWVLMLVHVDTDLTAMSLTLYDPLDQAHNHAIMRDRWQTLQLPFIQEWWRRDCDRVIFPVGIHLRTVDKPKQRNGLNCGVLCVAQASHYV